MENKQLKDKMNVSEIEMLLCDLVLHIHSGLQIFYGGHNAKIIKE